MCDVSGWVVARGRAYTFRARGGRIRQVAVAMMFAEAQLVIQIASGSVRFDDVQVCGVRPVPTAPIHHDGTLMGAIMMAPMSVPNPCRR